MNMQNRRASKILPRGTPDSMVPTANKFAVDTNMLRSV